MVVSAVGEIRQVRVAGEGVERWLLDQLRGPLSSCLLSCGKKPTLESAE